MRLILTLLAAAAVSAPALLQAQSVAAPQESAKISTGAFAALPVLRDPRLSPNGRRIAALSTKDGKTILAVLDADRPSQAPRVISIGVGDLAAIRWAGDQRLLLTIKALEKLPWGFGLPFLRLIAVDVDTGFSRVVDKKSRGVYAGDVLYADPTGAWALVASQDDVSVYPSVKRVDLATGDATLVEKARNKVWDWYADDSGVVRAGVAYEGRRWTIWYRDRPDEKLRKMRGKFAKDDSAVDRLIFGRDSNSWILTNERTGRFGVYKYDLETGAVGDAVFEHAEVDVDDVTYNSLTGKITAVDYQDDRARTVWFDPELEALQNKLDRALPHNVNSAVDWSKDEKRVLVWSGGASDPGRFYLLDRTTSKMHAVVDPYPAIDPAQLAPMKAVRYRARDGLGIPAYLTLPRGREARNLPLIVLPHGGPFRRDSWDYDPLVQFLASRGYAVLQPQFRGSTGYGKSFAEKGYGEWGKKMQDDLDDGVEWLARAGQIDPKRVCIVGASYGGYAALWGAIRSPERYRCAASWAGVSDLPAMLKYDRKLFSAVRYFREWRTMVAGEGKVDLDDVSPVRFADRLKVPVLIGHGEEDDNVPASQSRELVEALTKARADVTSVFYPDSGHDFGSSTDFEDWLKRLERFLARNNPA